jgi:hypothetical protein
MKNKILYAIAFVALIAFSARAQELKNEAGFLLGSEQVPAATTTADAPLILGGSVAFSFDYACRLRGRQTALSFEVPFAAAPSHHESGVQPGLVTSLATLYVVPSLRLQALANRRFSPWLSGGFGYGWLETSALYNNGARNPQVNRNTGTAQFGAGVDIRTPIQLIFRSLCGQSCVTTIPLTPPIMVQPFASRASTIWSQRAALSFTFETTWSAGQTRPSSYHRRQPLGEKNENQ